VQPLAIAGSHLEMEKKKNIKKYIKNNKNIKRKILKKIYQKKVIKSIFI